MKTTQDYYNTHTNDLSILVRTRTEGKYLILEYETIITSKIYRIPRSIDLDISDILKIYHDKFILDLRIENKSKSIDKLISSLFHKTFFKIKSIQDKNEKQIEAQLGQEVEKRKRRVGSEYGKMLFCDKTLYYKIPPSISKQLDFLVREIHLKASKDIFEFFNQSNNLCDIYPNDNKRSSLVEDRKDLLKEFFSLESVYYNNMFCFYKNFIVPFKEKAREMQNDYFVRLFEFAESMTTFAEKFNNSCQRIHDDWDLNYIRSNEILDNLTKELFGLFKRNDFDIFRRYLLKIDKCMLDVKELHQNNPLMFNISLNAIIDCLNLPVIKIMQYKTLLKNLLCFIFTEEIYKECKEIFDSFATKIENLNTTKKKQENYVTLIKLQTVIKKIPNHLFSDKKEFIGHLDLEKYTLFLLSEVIIITMRYIAVTDIRKLSTAQYKFVNSYKVNDFEIFETDCKYFIILLVEKIARIFEIDKNSDAKMFFRLFYEAKASKACNHSLVNFTAQTDVNNNSTMFSTGGNISEGSVEIKEIYGKEDTLKVKPPVLMSAIDVTAVLYPKSEVVLPYSIINITDENALKQYDTKKTVFIEQGKTVNVFYNNVKFAYENFAEFRRDFNRIIQYLCYDLNNSNKSLSKLFVQNRILEKARNLENAKFQKDCSFLAIKNKMDYVMSCFNAKILNSRESFNKNIRSDKMHIDDGYAKIRQDVEAIINYFYKTVLMIFTTDELEIISKDIKNVTSIKYFEKYKINAPFLEILQFLVDCYNYSKLKHTILALDNVFFLATKEEVLSLSIKLRGKQ